MNTKRCVYCGQVITGADYHVVGIGQDYANLYACVGCWRECGVVTEVRETGVSRHNTQNLRQAGLWAVLAALAIFAIGYGRLWACGVTG